MNDVRVTVCRVNKIINHYAHHGTLIREKLWQKNSEKVDEYLCVDCIVGNVVETSQTIIQQMRMRQDDDEKNF